jgi:uncharacterized membrane protein YfcA
MTKFSIKGSIKIIDTTNAWILIGAAVGGFVQGITGFAFGLVAMSFWAWFIPPELAAPLAVSGALSGQVMAQLTAKRRADLKILGPFILGGLTGIPIGVGILPYLDLQLFKAILGVILLLWCPAILQSHRLPRIEATSRVADGVIGAIGGIMCGFGGFSGIVPTLWCTLKGLVKDEHRSVVQNFNLLMLSVTMAFYISKGLVTRSMLPLFAMIVPAILVSSLFGKHVYSGITEATFRRLTLGTLTLSGIAFLSSSLPNILG